MIYEDNDQEIPPKSAFKKNFLVTRLGSISWGDFVLQFSIQFLGGFCPLEEKFTFFKPLGSEIQNVLIRKPQKLISTHSEH